MDNNFSSQYLTARRAVVQTEVEVKPTPARTTLSLANEGDLFIVVICFIGIGISFFSWASCIRTSRQQLALLKRSQDLPCGNCRYFQANAYLNCAVQPLKVLQEEAKNCPDYQPESNQADCQPQFSHRRNDSHPHK